MKRTLHTLILLASSTMLPTLGCSAEVTNEPGGAPEVPEVPPGVTVEIHEPIELTEAARLPEQWPEFISVHVTANRLTYTFEDGLSGSHDLEVGNVIAGPSDGGYLRRVISSSEEGERVVVETEPAQLVDLIARGHFEATFDPDPSQWNMVPRAGTLPLISRFIDDFECDVADVPSAEMSVLFEMKSGFQLEIKIGYGGLERASFAIIGSQEVGVDFAADLSFDASCTKDLLGEVGREWTTYVPIWPLVIPVTHELSPSAELQFGGAMTLGSAAASKHATFELRAGAEYENDEWKGIWDAAVTGTSELEVQGEGELSLQTGVAAGVVYTTKLWDVVGPEIGLEARAEATFGLNTCEYTIEVEAALEGTMAAKLDVPLIDLTLAELRLTRELASTSIDSQTGIQLGCEEPTVDEITPVSASGGFDGRGGVLEVAVSPTDAEGNFVGHGLSVDEFEFTQVMMTPEFGGEPISLTTTVQMVVVDEPTPGAVMTAVVVFDSSGSMLGNDPGAIGRSAGARAFFEEVEMTDSVAVLDFGAGVSSPLLASRLLQDFTSDTGLLDASIDQLTEAGGTPLYDSLLDALGLLEPFGGGGGGVVVVLTDGQDGGSSSSASDVIAQAQVQGVQIFAVGLGDSLGFADLRALGSETGGGFVEAGNAMALEQTFRGISAGIKVGRVTVIGEASYPELEAGPMGRYSVSGNLETLATFQTPFQFTVDIQDR